MKIKTNTPEIAALRAAVEQKYGISLKTPRHFSSLSEDIGESIRDYLSDTTLQRVWQYKAGYDSIAIHTLNVLSRYVGYSDWESFCRRLKDLSNVESVMYDGASIDVKNLAVGTTLRIGWLPDRVCIIKYLGDFRFEAIETHNSKLCAGDIFTCVKMQIGREMCLDNLARGLMKMNYVIGTRNGLTNIDIIG